MRNERLGRSSASLILKDWRFNFHEAAIPEILANLLNQTRAGEEAVARFIVCHQIHIAAAIAFLLIGKAVKLLRWLLKRLGKHRPLFDNERLLALLRSEKLAFRTDDIAEI